MIFAKNSKGFTIIELLVVIAIIGLITTLALAALQSARVKGRNAARLVIADQYVKALEMSYNERGKYPVPSTGILEPFYCIPTETCWNGFYSGDSAIYDAFAEFIPSMPTMDNNICQSHGYLYHCNELDPDDSERCIHPVIAWAMEGTYHNCGVGRTGMYDGFNLADQNGCTVCWWETSE